MNFCNVIISNYCYWVAYLIPCIAWKKDLANWWGVRYLELSVPKFCGMYRMRDVPAGKGNGFYSWVAGAWSTWIVSLLLPLASWS